MSEPFRNYEEPLRGAHSELVSAMSALNMNAEPIPGATGYLSETDHWAKHSMEHLHAVAEQLQLADRERSAFRHLLFRAVLYMTETSPTPAGGVLANEIGNALYRNEKE